MEIQDGNRAYGIDDPAPPKYEKVEEIQEFDASGQLVTTVTALRGVFSKDSGFSYSGYSFTDDFIAKYPENRVDVSIPRRSHSWMKSFMDIFLPTGYPNSVTEDYLEYQIYDSLQAFSSSIASLIASRAVLEGVGVGDATASPTTAILLSVLQDTTGRIATILFAARLGLSLEPECKRWRLAADILNDAAMVLDCLSPALPKPLRVGVLSGAAALRALCGVAAGSAKASLSAHFAKSNNLGELNAKDSSQETIISLLGMLTGTALIPLLTTPLTTWTALLLLLSIHLYTNHRAVRAVSLRTLNRQRASLLYSTYLSLPPSLFPTTTPPTLPTPTTISHLETTIHLHPSSLHLPTPNKASASFTPLSSLPPSLLHSLLPFFKDEDYILHYSPRERHARIILKTSSTPRTALKAWFCARVCAEVAVRAERVEHPGGGSAVADYVERDRQVVGGGLQDADRNREDAERDFQAAERYREGAERDLQDSKCNLKEAYQGLKDSKQDREELQRYVTQWRTHHLRHCINEVSQIWPLLEKGMVMAGWEIDVGALETRARRRVKVVREGEGEGEKEGKKDV